MSKITIGGKEVEVKGRFLHKGEHAPEFFGVGADLKDTPLSSFGDKRKVLNIFPSLDTDTCAITVRTFSKKAAKLPNTVVINVSCDLPFAQKRFCVAEGIDINNVSLSLIRGREFLINYGVEIGQGGLAGLAARAVYVLDEKNQIIYSELVPALSTEPNYDAALSVLH
eukprot:TRINITY_DN1651_c0_g1_i5.p1 TRINITY_DN1651_c0_g1~~TRINITY_DN1651_c0_g1_i5.p1  ORF type:complete len:168 (+),score=40.24 TRINITY_DN1651_c0_g1_i5:401-904(+)